LGIVYVYLRHQVLLGILPGLILGLVTYLVPLNFFRKGSLFFMAGALILSIMIFVPGIGFMAGGARRWINLGFTTIQPAEILKLAFIIYLASWLVSRVDRYQHKKIVEENIVLFTTFSGSYRFVGRVAFSAT